MKIKSLGMIETYGFTPAVVAVDTGLKAANVELISCILTPPARMTVQFNGDVAAVKTAVTAAEAAAGKVGKVISVHVIPRPVPGLSFFSDIPEELSFQDPPPPPKPKRDLNRETGTREKGKKKESPQKADSETEESDAPSEMDGVGTDMDAAEGLQQDSEPPSPKKQPARSKRRVKKNDTAAPSEKKTDAKNLSPVTSQEAGAAENKEKKGATARKTKSTSSKKAAKKAAKKVKTATETKGGKSTPK